MTKAVPSQVERSISVYIEVLISGGTTNILPYRQAGRLVTHSESTPQQNLSWLSSVGSKVGLEELSS